MEPSPQPWSPREATEQIHRIAENPEFDLTLTKHALLRMKEREIINSDVLWSLRGGTVPKEHQGESTASGFCEHIVEGTSPNSPNRRIRITGIPDNVGNQIKIATVMWKTDGGQERCLITTTPNVD
ncbi:MAG: DUF4258 domain-containing protein [Rhodobacteraceae bacterium]|nr:DUF4258 domain-containing protein [Paracoccaceae bacterium]